MRPRNPAEEYMVDRMPSLAWKGERIDRAQMAQLSKRVHHAGVDAAETELEQVISLGERLLGDIHAARAVQPRGEMDNSVTDNKARSASAVSIDHDHPMHLVLHLQTTVAGCPWMLDQWTNLRTVLERDLPWVAADQLTAVRLLGHNPIDAFNNIDVARLYVASHVLLDQGGEPFQAIMNELSHGEATGYQRSLQMRRYDALAPKDAADALQALLDIVDQATEQCQMKMKVLCKIAELDAASAADRASWDDSDLGERLRRYEITCNRTWLRMFDLLCKTRPAGEELDLATVASSERFTPARQIAETIKSAPSATDVATPTAEPAKNPDPPIEAKPTRENAPNEPNSSVHNIISERRDAHKEFKIDTPRLDCKAGRAGITVDDTFGSARSRLMRQRPSTLLDLSSIFPGDNTSNAAV